MTHFPTIQPIDVLARLAAPNAPIVLDIRLPDDLADDPTRLPGAVQIAFDDLQGQLNLSATRGAIVVCWKGLKLSAGATARLRSHGVDAVRMTGGHVGWRAEGLPVLSNAAPSRIALPLDASLPEALAAWACLRFDAPLAELLEVPRGDLPGVVDRFEATAPTSMPDLPGLSALPGADHLVALALAEGPPSALFPTFDLAFRSALRHERVTSAAHGAEA